MINYASNNSHNENLTLRGKPRARPVLRDTAHQNFMDLLLGGQLKPGLLVSQRELCEMTGSTIGSIREALKRLEAEGVISLIPQRGVIVRELEEGEINDVFETRKIIEVHAAQRFAEIGSQKLIVDIKQKTQEILERKTQTREDSISLSRERIAVDDLFHQTLIATLDNTVLDEIFERLRLQIQVSRLSVQPRFIDSRPALREHLVIIEALENGNSTAAATAMLEHLERAHGRAIGTEWKEI